VTISATDLLAPRGTLVPALYPHLSGPAIQQMLEEWLLLGYQAATDAGVVDPTKQDLVARAFASLRWYEGALDRIIGSPTTSALADKESHSYSTKQLELLEERASHWRDILAEALTPVVVSEEASVQASSSVPATFSW